MNGWMDGRRIDEEQQQGMKRKESWFGLVVFESRDVANSLFIDFGCERGLIT